MLVDCMAWLYRAHHGNGAGLTSKNGKPTGAAHTFLHSLWRLLELRPGATHLAAVFDHPSPTFRHALYSEYKAHRPPTPTDLIGATAMVWDILDAAGIAVLTVPGVEADDVVATLATRAVKSGMTVDICSPDRDFRQLLRPGVCLLRPGGKLPDGRTGPIRIYDEASLLAEFPELHSGSQYADLLALKGDSSDNVPNIKGLGAVTARSLLKAFGSAEAVLEAAAEGGPAALAPAKITKRVAEALASPEGAATVRRAAELVRLVADVDAPETRQPWQDLRLRVPLDGGAKALDALAAVDLTMHTKRLRKLWETHPAFS